VFLTRRRPTLYAGAAVCVAAGICALAGRAPASQGHPEERMPAENAAQRQLAEFRDVTLRAELGTRYEAATCNLLTRHDRYSLESYRAQSSDEPGGLWLGWPGDQVGRMLTAMHVAEGYGWTPVPTLRSAVGDVVLPCQTKDGNFGKEMPLDHKDAKVLSGNAFALRGLMDAYEDTREERYVAAARKLARYFESTFDVWKEVNGEGPINEYYGHCIDGLVRLYELGGDEWALDLAKRIGRRAGRTTHAHHSLSMCRGVLHLYRVTGDAEFLTRTQDYLRWCDENRLVTGGIAELMPKSGQDEGCALADYIVVNLMAFAATGNDEYLDDAEHILVNHFFMHQFRTGGFGHRVFAQEVIGGKLWQGWEGRFGSENPGCCSIWGQVALGKVGRYIVTRSGGAVELNLYPSADVELAQLGVRLRIEGDFPRMHSAKITIRCDMPQRLALRLRLPRWAEGVEVKVNGTKTKPATVGSRMVLEREWRSGDVIEMAFAGSLRLVRWPDADSDRVAVFDGPLCLGLSSADADVDQYTSVLVDANGKLLLSPDGKPQLANADGNALSALRPICTDWQSEDVANPNRIRVLFATRSDASP
jgi:rhamnogalacturonyl hydrolase YesR